MPSDNEYLTYILELLREVDGITFKKMMGEFILYKNGTIFGGVYDNRFLVKKSKSLKEQIFGVFFPQGTDPLPWSKTNASGGFRESKRNQRFGGVAL